MGSRVRYSCSTSSENGKKKKEEKKEEKKKKKEEKKKKKEKENKKRKVLKFLFVIFYDIALLRLKFSENFLTFTSIFLRFA